MLPACIAACLVLYKSAKTMSVAIILKNYFRFLIDFNFIYGIFNIIKSIEKGELIWI